MCTHVCIKQNLTFLIQKHSSAFYKYSLISRFMERKKKLNEILKRIKGSVPVSFVKQKSIATTVQLY